MRDNLAFRIAPDGHLRSSAELRVSNAPEIASGMKRTDDRDLRELLMKLTSEHRELDNQIIALDVSAEVDQLRVKRLKKRKLLLKDQIKAIEDQLTPDIIA